MNIQFNMQPGQTMLELGAGGNAHPQSTCRVDVRPCPGTDFCCDFERPLPISNQDFNVLFGHYVIEHLSWRALKGFLKECLRVLKPGGRAVFVTANTEAQLKFVQENQEGWDEKPPFESFSCLLFGDQDYSENTHKNYLSPVIAHKLMQEAGFEGVKTLAWGARNTDLLIDAIRPVSTESNPEPVLPVSPAAVPRDRVDLSRYTREELFDKHYFNGGGKVGGYAKEGYRDFPAHEIIARNVLYRKPESVLELGSARGYVLKRIQDAGVRGQGLEISKHCFMTRACEGLVQHDVCNVPWPLNNQEVDLAFSQSFLEHLPEEHLDKVLQEMKRTTRRSLHGIDFGEAEDGFDQTHVNLKPKDWWMRKFEEHRIEGEILDKEELQAPPFPPEVLRGDGKVKLNIGCQSVMFHHGWQNIDVHDYEVFAKLNGFSYHKQDIREGIKHKTGTVHALFFSHFLEHLSYKEGLSFLRDCRRAIKQDGAMRIAVPDASLLLAKHASALLGDYDEINDGCANASTQTAKLWELLHEGHLALYDWPTLRDLLHEAGFLAKRSAFRSPEPPVRENTWQIIRETTDTFPCLSLYVDAFPLVG